MFTQIQNFFRGDKKWVYQEHLQKVELILSEPFFLQGFCQIHPGDLVNVFLEFLNINQTYQMADIVAAHRDLESGSTSGSSIIVP